MVGEVETETHTNEPIRLVGGVGGWWMQVTWGCRDSGRGLKHPPTSLRNSLVVCVGR